MNEKVIKLDKDVETDNVFHATEMRISESCIEVDFESLWFYFDKDCGDCPTLWGYNTYVDCDTMLKELFRSGEYDYNDLPIELEDSEEKSIQWFKKHLVEYIEKHIDYVLDFLANQEYERILMFPGETIGYKIY